MVPLLFNLVDAVFPKKKNQIFINLITEQFLLCLSPFYMSFLQVKLELQATLVNVMANSDSQTMTSEPMQLFPGHNYACFFYIIILLIIGLVHCTEISPDSFNSVLQMKYSLHNFTVTNNFYFFLRFFFLRSSASLKCSFYTQ